MLFAGRSRPMGLLVLGSVLPLFGVYTDYYFGGGGDMGVRFFVPLIPVLVFASFWALGSMAKGSPRVVWPLAVALLLMTAAMNVPSALPHDQRAGQPQGGGCHGHLGLRQPP